MKTPTPKARTVPVTDPLEVASIQRGEETQSANPSAPDYDWQDDREWFNQRLANANIRNASLHNRLSDALCTLRVIRDGAKYAKQLAANALARDDAARLTETIDG